MSDPGVPRIEVRDLDMIFGGYVVQKNINLSIASGEIFVIMGGSGSGKSTLLRHMTGLVHPVRGDAFYDGVGYWAADDDRQAVMRRRFGVLFQSGALWSSMTLAENVALPLAQYTGLSPGEIAEIVALKLSLVGLHGFEEYYPSEISGGMRKRAGLARAMALDPDILFFDEPSAGLDPISSKRLDDLILQLRDSLGATVVMVTHELASIFAVADNSIFLDAETRTPIAHGNPRVLRETCPEQKVRDFLMRGEPTATAA
jgi:phospholipid/cholesterol/gamma-HCH transport system ATP-binding protein